MIGGFNTETPIFSEVVSAEPIPSSVSYSRAWLAAEVLCTWHWPGGSTLTSFLPSLSKFAENSASPGENIVFSILKLLLDGSLVSGASCEWISFNAWTLSYDEVENIQDPFLRSLMSLLWTLIMKDKVWGECESLAILTRVLDKLYASTPVDRACLRILPYVLCVIIPRLLSESCISHEPCKDASLISLKEDLLHKNILSWLETALSFPPFACGETGPGENANYLLCFYFYFTCNDCLSSVYELVTCILSCDRCSRMDSSCGILFSFKCVRRYGRAHS